MSSIQTITLTLPDSAATFRSLAQLTSGVDPNVGLRGVINYLEGIAGGRKSGTLVLYTGAAAGTAVLTVSTGGSTAAETMVLCGVTFTAKASGATGNEFNVSATAATQATNMVTAFNASADLLGIVTATNALGVITITATVAGKAGNALVVTESLTNVAVTTSFATAATGSNGTIYTLNKS